MAIQVSHSSSPRPKAIVQTRDHNGIASVWLLHCITPLVLVSDDGEVVQVADRLEMRDLRESFGTTHCWDAITSLVPTEEPLTFDWRTLTPAELLNYLRTRRRSPRLVREWSTEVRMYGGLR